MTLRSNYALLFGLLITTLSGCNSNDVEEVINQLISNTLLTEEVIEVNERLATVSFSGQKTLSLEVAVGSGAFHYRDDPIDEFYTITDRGPTIACNQTMTLLGMSNFCINNNVVDETGTLFPVSNFTPEIYKFNVDTSGLIGAKVGYHLLQAIPLRDRYGNFLQGLPNPSTVTTTENAYDKTGKRLATDPNSVAPEAIIKLSDGTFWLGENYAPSLLHVDATGHILERFVPRGVESELAGANYQVVGRLPAILKKRQWYRGIEGLAVSPDEQYLYFILSSPLANPNDSAANNSRYVRLFKVSLRSGNLDQVVGEYVYVIDLAATFTADNTNQQSDVKISEMVALDTDKLIMVERATRQTKLYQVATLRNGTNLLDSQWDEEKTYPSLEMLSNLVTQGITALDKKLVFNSASELPTLDANIEGLAVLSNEFVAFINDNEFGIRGDKTRITIRKLVRQLSQ